MAKIVAYDDYKNFDTSDLNIKLLASKSNFRLEDRPSESSISLSTIPFHADKKYYFLISGAQLNVDTWHGSVKTILVGDENHILYVIEEAWFGLDEFRSVQQDGMKVFLKGGDQIVGSDADDKLFGYDGGDSLEGGNGRDQMFGGEGNDTLKGGADDDQMSGSAGNDSMLGGSGLDVLEGEDGNDDLDGSQGTDFLRGGAGDDLLRGGSGVDHMTGGDGKDAFRFDKLGGPLRTFDFVADFKPGVDSFFLNGDFFKGLGPEGELGKDHFAVTGDKPGPGAHVIYNPDGWLSYDPDGSGPGMREKITRMPTDLDMSFHDITII